MGSRHACVCDCSASTVLVASNGVVTRGAMGVHTVKRMSNQLRPVLGLALWPGHVFTADPFVARTYYLNGLFEIDSIRADGQGQVLVTRGQSTRILCDLA